MFCVSVVLVAVGSICTLDKAGRILTLSLQCLITKCMHPTEGRPPPAARDTHVLRGGTCTRQTLGMALHRRSQGAGMERELLSLWHSLGIAPAAAPEAEVSLGALQLEGRGEGGRGLGIGAN